MNVIKYYLYKFFNDLVLVYPVYPLLFERKGMSVAQISLLLIIWTVPALLFEIPSGVLADRWSRKKLLVIGSILKGLCFVCWFFADGFMMFALGFVLWGIGGTFCSGAEEALLFDSLKIVGKEDSFDRILGKGRFYSGVSLAFACLLGGYVTDLMGMDSILILSILAMVITTGITFLFTEINLYRVEQDKTEVPKEGKKERETLRDSLLFFKHSKNAILVILTIMVIGTAGILDEYDALIAKDFGLSFTLIGLWVCVRGLLSAVGCLLAPYIKRLLNKVLHLKRKLTVAFIISFIGAVFLLLSGGLHQLWSMSLYGLYYLLMSSGGVIVEDYLQQRIDEEGRSTVHSILSLLLNLFGMISFGVLSGIMTAGSLFTGLVIAAVYMMVLIIILWLADRRIKYE